MPAIAEVKYFFRLWFGNTMHSLALVFVFSPLDQEILELSNHAAYTVCHHGRIDALTVVDVKSITVVMFMVPDYQVMVSREIIIPENVFSLIEVPFVKLAALQYVVLWKTTTMLLIMLMTLLINVHYWSFSSDIIINEWEHCTKNIWETRVLFWLKKSECTLLWNWWCWVQNDVNQHLIHISHIVGWLLKGVHIFLRQWAGLIY